MEMSEVDAKNRKTLISLLGNIRNGSSPDGWRKVGGFAIGGLTDIGFSRHSDLLLVLSSNGRGVIDPAIGAVVARDYDQGGDWLDERLLVCTGIGPIAAETIPLAGLSGGGLPRRSGQGESLEVVSPNWPLTDLIYCSGYGSAVIERFQSTCIRLASDHIRAYGFSWSGNTFTYATGSDVYIYSRIDC
jgi:hypothetical protein